MSARDTQFSLKGSINRAAKRKELISIMEHAFGRAKTYIGGHIDFVNGTAFRRRLINDLN